MTNCKFDRLFGGPPRKSESKLTQREMDLAASIQEVTEEIMLRMAKHVRKETGLKNLCLAGGVALNCVANSKILRAGIFNDLWIQPAAGDAGGALGAAALAWHQYLGNERQETESSDSMGGSYLGPEFSESEIESFLQEKQIPFTRLTDEQISDQVADLIAQGKIIGWFCGRMEFGPRALGARSIIGDARNPKMQEVMNLKIKFRESFRPFAPSVLEEESTRWFELDRTSPYMLLVADVKKEKQKGMTQPEQNLFGLEKLYIERSEIPAVTHVDYSARVQTVSKNTNPKYHAFIQRFFEKTGCPAIINTSFNVRGEPIVCTPEDAYRCFMRTDIDYLVLENFLLEKAHQPPFIEKKDWKKKYALD